jgi:hypothetical protein
MLCVLGFQMGTFAQEDLAPPKTMKLCILTGCDNLTWAGEYYEGRHVNETALATRYWITTWERDRVELQFKSATAVDGVFPVQGTMRGTIAADGASIKDGTLDWEVGYSHSGKLTWTASWSNAPSNRMSEFAAGQFQAPRHSKTHPNILLPPGAAEVYASYPQEVRAILLPENAITPTDAKRPCGDKSITQAAQAIEIARYAYRTGDMKRGDCWLQTAMDLGSVRAKVIYATTLLFGWQGTPKDPVKGFGILKANLGTRDPWDVWQLTQCYIDGVGTPKDAHQAAILTSYTMTHDDVYQVSQMVGADDEELVHEFQRLSAFMYPPMTTKTDCNTMPARDSSGTMRKTCTTTSVVDDKALQRQLNNIDQDYKNKKSSNP